MRDPKLPYFDESKDKIVSYLTRFDKCMYASENEWNRNVWAVYFSALLKGRPLDVYGRLTADDVTDYEKLNDAFG